MAGYVIADVDVFDTAAFEDYRSKASATIEQYGGKYVARGGKTEVLEGDYRPHRVVVLEFSSLEQAQKWYNSPEYKPLIALRQKAARTNVIMVEGV